MSQAPPNGPSVIEHRRGNEEATVARTALRASMDDAAPVNGVAAHALDGDDVQASLAGSAVFATPDPGEAVRRQAAGDC